MARIDLRENEYMERFVGQDHINSNDVQFWYQLLSCSFNFMRVQDPKVVDKTLDPYLVRLALNNNQSLNIGSLLKVFLDRVSRIKSKDGLSTNSYYVFQSFNALYLIRCICKSYIENSSEEQLIKAFRASVDKVQAPQANSQPVPPPQLQTNVQSTGRESEIIVDGNLQQPANSVETLQVGPIAIEKVDEAKEVKAQEAPVNNSVDKTEHDSEVPKEQEEAKVEVTPGATMIDQFISTIIAILVDIPVNDSTYLLQVESINALLVLLSIQMFSPRTQSYVYRSLMQKKCSIHALVLTKTLLNNFVRQQPMPQEANSIIIGLASGLWKVLTLGYGSQEDEESESIPLLARQSLLLLNILTNHYTSEKNPYREAIVSCQDYNLSDPQKAFENATNDAIATAIVSKATLTSNSIKIDFLELFETICRYLHNDQVALLLYLLLHSNKIFRPYILTTASSQMDKILLPMLKILYSSIEKGSHHVYMILIIFTILSEENTFNEAVHKITIRGVPWYKDRLLSEISLGSLATLIVIRSFQYNTFRIKDKFLHTNLFATLANLSNHFHYLHPYVCQRIVDLLERLTKRYLQATKPAAHDRAIFDRNQTCEVLNTDNPLARALATDTFKQDMKDASSMELDSTSGYSSATTINSQRNENAININIPNNQLSNAIGLNQQQNNNLILPPVDSQGREYVETSNQAFADNNSGQQSPNSNNSISDHISISLDDAKQDLNLIEEVIRMILEVINNSLAEQLRNNPDLIYTLLYKRNVFSNLLSSHPSFYNLVINVERILTFFYNKIEAYERPLSVLEIKELIHNTSKDWNYDNNRDPNSRLLFHYVEDEQPEDFFIPYIWTRIYYSSGIAWNSKRIQLFNPDDL